jgi:hypothetical protein
VLYLLYHGGRSLAYWLHNTTSPPKAYAARVINKRTQTSGWSGSQFGHIDTYYFVTFEFRNGERREYEVSGQEFGMLVEGDEGQVTAKGTRYEYFDRAA